LNENLSRLTGSDKMADAGTPRRAAGGFASRPADVSTEMNSGITVKKMTTVVVKVNGPAESVPGAETVESSGRLVVKRRNGLNRKEGREIELC
jgi:hypothetical protein